MKASDLFVKCLEAEGVERIFGVPGEENADFMLSLEASSIDFVLTRHEQGAAFMAEIYGRLTGNPAGCLGTLGPGATNLVTGLVESLNAGIPQVVFVGDTHRDHAWKNMTQEARQVEILRPAAKEVIRIERVWRIPELIRQAFAVATSGRPGPVVLDIPEDV